MEERKTVHLYRFSFFGLIAYRSLMGYLMPSPSFKKNSRSTIYNIAGGVRKFLLFPMVYVQRLTLMHDQSSEATTPRRTSSRIR